MSYRPCEIGHLAPSGKPISFPVHDALDYILRHIYVIHIVLDSMIVEAAAEAQAAVFTAQRQEVAGERRLFEAGKPLDNNCHDVTLCRVRLAMSLGTGFAYLSRDLVADVPVSSDCAIHSVRYHALRKNVLAMLEGATTQRLPGAISRVVIFPVWFSVQTA
jgi:hypothetical protein